ncbi:MAG TPA: hypothetical protein VK483_05965 [Chitinophagaceae bacterium]|nr:hypothetical protein [Chitinophagaceae bacterium]
MKRILKINWLILISIFFSNIQSATAQTLKDIFTSSETPILYLGIDYTQARLIGGTDGTGIQVRDLYPAINNVVVNEPKKYDLQGAFHKSSINNSLGIVTKRNKEINGEDIISTESSDYNRLKEEDINKLVKGIDFEKKKGIGLLFIVEAMKKGEKGGTSSIWVTFVDMGANKVLMTERMDGITGGGFGFRNFWASTIFNVIETIDKKKYKEWKKQYGN